MYSWARRSPTPGTGYEVSSKGDRRFSAFHAILADGRSIEYHYQCDVKGYDPGGTDWRLGKGKPPLIPHPGDSLWLAYLRLWKHWAFAHPRLIMELALKAKEAGYLLTDCFASTDINQARALATILNECFSEEGLQHDGTS